MINSTEFLNLKPPKHIAIIMDGNARWSKQHNHPTSYGHKKGSENIIKIAKDAIELGVEYLTIYAFSLENWQRPKSEVDYLMRLSYEYLETKLSEVIKNDIKIKVIGNLDKIDSKMTDKIKQIEHLSKDNNKLVLTIAFTYGSRQEIVDAAKKIANDIDNKKINSQDLDIITFNKYLYTSEIPDPDLLIRTGGDHRLSNFLLWQCAYSELYFSELYWPEFDKEELIKAIKNFNQRERRYGKR